jgi:ethanolamine utilization microcompartment shell protein EutL
MLAAKSLIRRATRITSLTTYHGSSSPSTAAADTVMMMMGGNNTHAVLRRGYHDNIIEHYENPRNVGSLDKNDDHVGTVRVNDYIN